MIFQDRVEAGQKLAVRLEEFKGRSDVVALGVPRGGIPVATEVAAALGVPLDFFVIRKLGVPGQEELAFGAVSSGGVRVMDSEIVELLRLSGEVIEEVTQVEMAELQRRERIYRAGCPPLDVHGKTVLLIDDGIATGSSLRAGVCALRQLHPAAIIIAAPVAPPSTVRLLAREADGVVCVITPEEFRGVGQFYRNFSQLSDREVIALVESAAMRRLRPQSGPAT